MGVTLKGGTLQQPARPPPLLMTKLHSPAGREQTVLRDHLRERLRPSRGTKLTVVAAPAGYGKTTLLGEWCELGASELPIAWLTLDEGDNDLVALWSYVIEALRRACPGLELAALPEQGGGAHMEEGVLPGLINA